MGGLVLQGVPGVLLVLEDLDLRVDFGDLLQQFGAALRGGGAVAFEVALLGKRGPLCIELPDGVAEAVDGGGEEFFIGLGDGAAVGVGGVEHIGLRGEFAEVGDIFLLGKEPFLADGEVVGVERLVGERDGVVEVARALDGGVGRAEEDADDGALVRRLRHAAEDVGEERGVGGAAAVRRVVGGEAVGVERRGEHQHLLGVEVALPALFAREDDPEVAALGVDEAAEGVD